MDYDDWLVESIKRYDTLSMFDVRHAVTAVDWVNQSGLLLATDTNSANKFELMELLLPDKMLNTDLSKLSKDRDFRVHNGGFSHSRINSVKHIPATRYCVITRGERSAVELWEMGDDSSNLITPAPGKTIHATSTISNKHPTQISNVVGNNLVFGSSLADITVVDLDTFTPLTTFTQQETENPSDRDSIVTDIILKENTEIICGTKDGQIVKFDSRQKSRTHCARKQSFNRTSVWRTAFASSHLVQVSSTGNVCKVNLKDINDVQDMKLNLPPFQNGVDDFCVQCCPNDDRVSISDLNGEVSVFNLLSDSNGKTIQSEPEFTHDGHVMNSDQSERLKVLQHLWYPGKQDIIVSMATDGSLHAWKYKT